MSSAETPQPAVDCASESTTPNFVSDTPQSAIEKHREDLWGPKVNSNPNTPRRPSNPATPVHSQPGTPRDAAGVTSSIAAMEAARQEKIAEAERQRLLEREQKVDSNTQRGRKNSLDAFEAARLKKLADAQAEQKNMGATLIKQARSRSASRNNSEGASSVPKLATGGVDIAACSSAVNGGVGGLMSPVPEGVTSPTSPVDDLAVTSDPAVTQRLAEAAEEQRKRRAEEEARTLEEKAKWAASVQAKQARTSVLLAETQAKKLAAERAEAERIDAERVAATKAKAEATLRFEEERKLKAMTPEQREQYEAQKREELERIENERLQAELAAAEAIRVEKERLAEAQRIEDERLAEEKRVEEERLAEVRRVESKEAAEHAEAQAVAKSTLDSIVVQVAGADAPSPASSLGVPEHTFDNQEREELSRVAASTKQGDQQRDDTHGQSVSVDTPNLAQNTLPTAPVIVVKLEPVKAAESTPPTTTQKATENPQQAANPKQQPKPKKKKSSWFCCGNSTHDEEQAVPAESRPQQRPTA